MKPQIATGTLVISRAYGDVLFRAWRDCTDPVLRDSMEDVLQGLVHDAIHAADAHYFDGLRCVLRSFHGSRRSKELECLLLKAHGPILWRSLKCANAQVRSQAALLFFDVFPIQDGSATASAADNDHLMQRQFELQKTLLEDADHRVRAAAASGVCRMLRDYWEAVPAATTQKFLGFIASKLGSDASSALVRVAVVQGLHGLLDNPLSHSFMRSLLPAIATSLNDTSDKVRSWFVKILCKVKP
jgi:condensin-2 complex subunit G2